MKLARSKTEFGAFGNTFFSNGLKCLTKKSVSVAKIFLGTSLVISVKGKFCKKNVA